ncbi:MAG: hypothetical protein KC516_03810 [Nanoarchaeota archaeon]|nr:hypothetical protein [Nanoarchaeota archaeon]
MKFSIKYDVYVKHSNTPNPSESFSRWKKVNFREFVSSEEIEKYLNSFVGYNLEMDWLGSSSNKGAKGKMIITMAHKNRREKDRKDLTSMFKHFKIEPILFYSED